MSWLSIPLPNPFKSLQSDDPQQPIPSSSPSPSTPSDQSPSSHAGGVKEDLSVLGQTIGRQLRGVAAFLAPPPPPATATSSAVAEDTSSGSSSQTLLGIRNDLVEIGGSFKSGLSLLSGNKAVSEISRFASNLLQFQNEDDDEAYEGVGGITEEVIDFAKEISMRPECWIDFPLSLDNEFHMSDAQKEHGSTIEHLVPTVAALRLKLCSYMSDEHFWMIYFILLLPRLNEHDSKLLSTPEIVEAREILLQKLKNRRTAQVNSENSKSVDSSPANGEVSETRGENIPLQEKEVLAETVSAAQGLEMDEQKNIEQWLQEEDDYTHTSPDSQKQLENEVDVSFSDLEDDDNDISGRQLGFRSPEDTGVSSPNGSNDWVQLNESSDTQGGQQRSGQSISRERDSEVEEPNDWLTVDDFD